MEESLSVDLLKDGDIIQTLLPGIRNRLWSIDKAVKAIAEEPGWAVVAVDADVDGGLVYFVNVGQQNLDGRPELELLTELIGRDPNIESFAAPFAILEALPDDARETH